MEEVRERLTTPSSATAERGAVAAWWSEGKAYELEKKVARTRRVRARTSSYRDTRSRSLQRMVRRLAVAFVVHQSVASGLRVQLELEPPAAKK